MFDLRTTSRKLTKAALVGKREELEGLQDGAQRTYIYWQRVYGLAEGDVCITASLTPVGCVCCYCI